ncbi:MAG: A/G-specific adenine glycosylase [Oscillospiraceae bacterium]
MTEQNTAPRTQPLRDIVAPLLAWYRACGRDLPWRREPTPYHVWVSEIMLQQTRIEAALPYYRRFITALPDVAALAAVEDDRLMKLWEGLGYYSRARNLKKAAVLLMSDYGGRLPREAAELKKLPGIGDYTAGAIASIAYGQPEPAVDGNVLRVLTRLQACGEDVMRPGTRALFAGLLREVYPTGEDAGCFTQALMELGERVCLPNGEPLCPDCPLRERCAACRTGTVSLYPVRSEKKPRRAEQRTVLLLSCQGRYAIRRREESGLLAGLWEFPNVEGWLPEEELPAFLRSLGLEPLSCQPSGEGQHIFSHVEWHMRGFRAECRCEGGDFLWVRPEELKSAYALPSAFRVFLRQIT